ncbi:hypothetical protein SAMN04515618_104237 [Collimonas sp. OK307]|nr:hypothetical protein SAMN04515618_104237 [Collimonas sp. OK307]
MRLLLTAGTAGAQLQRCASATLCAVSLAGCTIGPDFVRPENGLREVTLLSRADYANVARTSDSDVPSQWWMLFNDAVLGDLKIASERIEQSRAQLGIVSSQLLPSVAGRLVLKAYHCETWYATFAALAATSKLVVPRMRSWDSPFRPVGGQQTEKRYA